MSFDPATAKQSSSLNVRRSAARLAAVQAVYQMMTNAEPAASVITAFKTHPPQEEMDGEKMIAPDPALLSAIAQGVEVRRSDLETLLAGTQKRRNSTGGDSAYAPYEPLLQSILLCGAYELLAHHDTDAPVIISDYINVAHAFYEQGEAKLVNGVLDAIRKNVRDGN
jgi:N utilization substance protein B